MMNTATKASKASKVRAKLQQQADATSASMSIDPETGEILDEPPTSTPFGTWLLQQVKRDGWIGDLAKGAKADRGFPKAGDPEAVRKRLRELQAEGDMYEAVDDAELEWLAY